ncbi:FAD-dependent oxidoreductase, partial [Streptomyces sp. NPDC005181]|uniref:NAD(P)/FAD-dependent oxidoreductase n=1 Tax=Streptomyces sp. NPDC005181 TaxID=3156869 RepID=UPI0033AA45C1
VVVGGSLAAVTAVDALRQNGYVGPITLLGDEPHLPYIRPPLSKSVLKGDEPPDSVALPAFSDDVTVRLNVRAAGLDLGARRVLLADGAQVPFAGLVVATGARARRLAAPSQHGEVVLRTVDDAIALRDSLGQRPRVLIVGAGFLGLEIASVCRGLGLDVTVVDREPPLVRQLGSFLAELMTDAALDHGVKLVISPGGVRLLGDRRITGVQLADGDQLSADLVVTAVGCQPNVEWLEHSGITTAGGVLVDDRCRVAPGVVAAGDVVAFRSEPGGAPRRTPQWASAIDQARAAAAALVHGGAAAPHRPAPYFWTEAFGLNIKVCGPIPAEGNPVVLDGSTADRSALLQWRHGDQPVVAASVNYKMSVVKLRRLAQRPSGR